MPAETTIQTQSEAEAKMVDLPAEGDSVDVEISDKKETIVDTSPKEEIKEKEVIVEETASSEEMEEYGKKVQSRIDKLTKRLRESERREQAAIQYAQGVQSEQGKLQNKVRSLDTGYLTEFSTRVEAETAETKKEVIEKYKLSDQDTGSAEVQVALLSERINSLMDHFNLHKKDHHSRRGLLMMVNKRRKLLDYLKNKNISQYQQLISKLWMEKRRLK